jgi:hypothetical protein
MLGSTGVGIGTIGDDDESFCTVAELVGCLQE